MIIEQIAAILTEEMRSATTYTRENFGAMNGEHFPDIARAANTIDALSRKAITIPLRTLLEITLDDNLTPHKFAAQFQSPETSRQTRAYLVCLDFLWLGYRLGRRIEQMEAAELQHIEESK